MPTILLGRAMGAPSRTDSGSILGWEEEKVAAHRASRFSALRLEELLVEVLTDDGNVDHAPVAEQEPGTFLVLFSKAKQFHRLLSPSDMTRNPRKQDDNPDGCGAHSGEQNSCRRDVLCFSNQYMMSAFGRGIT